jgi:hypothetical protein
MVIDPAIGTPYGTSYERSRLFSGGRPSLEFVRSVELLPAPPARFSAALGDARKLAGPDASQDAVLPFGPLYHLTEAGQRRQALAQARLGAASIPPTAWPARPSRLASRA